ncbi:uncharacterized protein BDW43DRAFT_293852, partial [Aspergillus alliaceus]|uniref:uncharacterized protein n=1 Tax=Petromyces alliaceus TaxID=209559 RepID=UPI0012A51191
MSQGQLSGQSLCPVQILWHLLRTLNSLGVVGLVAGAIAAAFAMPRRAERIRRLQRFIVLRYLIVFLRFSPKVECVNRMTMQKEEGGEKIGRGRHLFMYRDTPAREVN